MATDQGKRDTTNCNLLAGWAANHIRDASCERCWQHHLLQANQRTARAAFPNQGKTWAAICASQYQTMQCLVATNPGQQLCKPCRVPVLVCPQSYLRNHKACRGTTCPVS